MIRKFITFFGLYVASTSLIAEVARGTVFVDSNENGLLDPGEMGVSDVRVSNGTQIVLSGAYGRY